MCARPSDSKHRHKQRCPYWHKQQPTHPQLQLIQTAPTHTKKNCLVWIKKRKKKWESSGDLNLFIEGGRVGLVDEWIGWGEASLEGLLAFVLQCCKEICWCWQHNINTFSRCCHVGNQKNCFFEGSSSAKVDQNCCCCCCCCCEVEREHNELRELLFH